MNQFNFVVPYAGSFTAGQLSTPITSSMSIKQLNKFPIYREYLPWFIRGLEVGIVHGYFLIGPFYKLGPLRNSEMALLAGYLSTIGLIVILSFTLTLYSKAVSSDIRIVESSNNANVPDWENFKKGFFIGALGSSGCAFLLLNSLSL